MRIDRIFAVLLLALAATELRAQTPPCRPCAGVRVDDPAAVAAALRAPPALDGEARLYVAWPAALDGSAAAGTFAALRDAGGTPWAVLRFRTPAPIRDHLEELEGELREVARLARSSGPRAHFQIDWPAAGDAAPGDLAFLIKRAAVTITGGNPQARVLAGPLSAEAGRLRALYAEDVAAYVDGIALAPAAADALAAAIALLADLDPGKPVVVDALPWPDDPRQTLLQAAAQAAAGVAVTFFRHPRPAAAELLPLKLLAREFQGDLSLDPSSAPAGAERAWSFVRGSDLGLRVIAAAGDGTELVFDDPQLRRPELVDPASGEESPIFGQRRTARGGLAVPVEGPVVLLRLERVSAAELEGIEEELTVAGERQLPVEEILRRLQAFEDDQARRLHHYRAHNTLHMRFRLGGGTNTIEATFAGDFFFERGRGFDWAWQDFYLNGVKWRRKTIPTIPLIQPEKAAVLPLEITFGKQYAYRLRGTAVVEGRDCWVVDFEPLAVQPGLHQGTVWIDREIYARVKTRALQVGLEGDVISSEETMIFTPVGAGGEPAPWTAESFILPTRVIGQQVWSILNSATQVERESELTAIEINGEGFDAARRAAYASEATMVRDTERGLRYLVKDEDSGERRVKEEIESTKLFLLGGVFYDASLDFPVPLAGINYFSLDFRGSGNQVNLFFAGPLITGNVAEPQLFGSRWDAGASIFGFFINAEEDLYRNGRQALGETVERRQARIALFLGRPLGSFWKLDFTYALRADDFGRAEDTDPSFIVPESTLTHRLEGQLSYNRGGWRGELQGSFSKRQDWRFWGLPGNDEFDPEQEDYLLWQARVSKTWWLPRFTKLAVAAEHLNGDDLDRFSKYDFSFFGDARVAGYQNGLVTASRASGLHLTYGLDFAEVFRVQLSGDAVWATDPATGLDNELLAGVSLNGTVVGPWSTLINFDVGYPVDGPAEDFVVSLAFLKLFK
ncbi:MAG: hypothetical protein D6696_20860 [Acidobacteria bacterium]|nr:MAG: hypothetical protein D6696_20860 [Acidobacteriota bacterium]